MEEWGLRLAMKFDGKGSFIILYYVSSFYLLIKVIKM